MTPEQLAYHREYQSLNKDRINAKRRENRRKNKEKARLKQREHRQKNGERINAIKRAWHAKNKNTINANRNTQASRDPQQRRAYSLKKLYGITLREYDIMANQQNNLCAICQRPPSGKGCHAVLAVDHDHKSGKVRGLLCAGCNKLLGYAKDNASVLQNAILYLGDANVNQH